MPSGPCPECGHTVALSAKSCPKCGNTSFRHYAGTRDAEEICTYCKGNGYTTRPELYCTSCNGWGKIIVTYDAFDDPRRVTTKNYKWSHANGPPIKSREFEKLICEIQDQEDLIKTKQSNHWKRVLRHIKYTLVIYGACIVTAFIVLNFDSKRSLNLPLYWQAILICTISFLPYLILFILSRLNSGTRYQKEWLKQKKQQLKEFR